MPFQGQFRMRGSAPFAYPAFRPQERQSMDAHLFRRLCQALTPVLAGARVVKIQEPHPGVFTFNLDLFSRSSSLGRRVQLVLSPGRKDPFLFLSTARLAANAVPSAMVMRLRKYAAGRGIRHVSVLWQRRELHLLLSGAMPAELQGGSRKDGDAPEAGGRLVWLVLSLRDGPSLRFADENDMPAEPEPCWPAADELALALKDWRSWPVLTPALRRTLACLDSMDARALLVDLEEGGGDIFCYTAPSERDAGRDVIRQVSAWPLPPSLQQGGEVVRADVTQALMEAGSDLVLSEASRRAARLAADPWRKKERRLMELLKLHTEDVARLEKMRARQEQGLLIQASLWHLPAGERRASVTVTDFEGAERELRLDQRYTVRENMERFFHTARRGERGLERVQTRRAELEAELTAVRREKEACLMGAAGRPIEAVPGSVQQRPLPRTPTTVQLFVSSDGHALLRGRSARGNQDARRMAAPHDLWVHVEGGPGAHVIIRRDHAAQEVPERTLDEAGSLAASRSWLKDEPSAKVNYCEIRHVRPLRGTAPGTMRMDKILFTRQVPVRPEYETRLLPENAGKAQA